jgi:hypothetical protein
MVSDRPFVGQKKVEMGWMEVQRGGAGCVCVCVGKMDVCLEEERERRCRSCS